ncbi:MAG: hypothetical protein ACODAJ_16715 [Planctomycetota bacterium]
MAGRPSLLVCTLVLWALAAVSRAGGIERLRVYYFGNSLTGNTMPTFHPALGKSAGKEWIVERSQGAGWQVWQHVYLDSARRHREKLAGGGFDAIVVQPFGGPAFHETVTQMWGKVHFDEPTDVGDLHCTAALIRLLLGGNPKGRAVVYSDWPGMRLKVPEEQKKLSKDLATAAEWHKIMEPFRKAFDYEKAWLREYDAEAEKAKKPWRRHNATRDHDHQLMEGLKKLFPGLWQQNRLNLLPAGDVFLAIDRAARAGTLPGVARIGDFFTNGVHIRSGLPRYTVAATFYAVLFRDKPHHLDWQLYNDQSTYLNKPRRWICCEKDLGVHLPITPERAKAVNDIIWEVVTTHPWAGVKE